MKKIIVLFLFTLFVPVLQAQIKISALPEATSLNNSDLFLLSQGATSKKLQYSTMKTNMLSNITASEGVYKVGNDFRLGGTTYNDVNLLIDGGYTQKQFKIYTANLSQFYIIGDSLGTMLGSTHTPSLRYQNLLIGSSKDWTPYDTAVSSYFIHGSRWTYNISNINGLHYYASRNLATANIGNTYWIPYRGYTDSLTYKVVADTSLILRGLISAYSPTVPFLLSGNNYPTSSTYVSFDEKYNDIIAYGPNSSIAAINQQANGNGSNQTKIVSEVLVNGDGKSTNLGVYRGHIDLNVQSVTKYDKSLKLDSTNGVKINDTTAIDYIKHHSASICKLSVNAGASSFLNNNNSYVTITGYSNLTGTTFAWYYPDKSTLFSSDKEALASSQGQYWLVGTNGSCVDTSSIFIQSLTGTTNEINVNATGQLTVGTKIPFIQTGADTTNSIPTKKGNIFVDNSENIYISKNTSRGGWVNLEANTTRNLTDNTNDTICKILLSTDSTASAIIEFGIMATNGTDRQSRGGYYQINTCKKAGSISGYQFAAIATEHLTGGSTLTESSPALALVGNYIYVIIKFDSSLNPTAGNFTIDYIIKNLNKRTVITRM